MAAILDIEFEWPVAAAGYQVVEYTPLPGLSAFGHPEMLRWAVQAAYLSRFSLAASCEQTRDGPRSMQLVPRSAETRQLMPLALNRELYLRFAELEDQPAAFAEFATRWGPLSEHGRDNQAEPAEVWSFHLKLMKSALVIAQRDPRFLAVGGNPDATLRARLVWDGRLSLRMIPPSLIDGLWLQLFQSLSQDTDIKSCDRCGRWFERGLGTERGRKARFCSDICRFGFHNERRGKGGSK